MLQVHLLLETARRPFTGSLELGLVATTSRSENPPPPWRAIGAAATDVLRQLNEKMGREHREDGPLPECAAGRMAAEDSLSTDCPIGQVQRQTADIFSVARMEGGANGVEAMMIETAFVSEPVIVPDVFATGILPVEAHGEWVRITYYCDKSDCLPEGSVVERLIVARTILPARALRMIAATVFRSVPDLAKDMMLDG